MSRPWAMATAAVPAAIPSRRFNSLVGWAGSWATVSMPLSVRRAAATGPMPGSGDAATAHLPGVVRRIRGRAGWPNRRSLPQRRTARLVRVTRQTFLCVRLVLPGRGVYDEDLAASAMPRVEAWPPCRNIAGHMSLLHPGVRRELTERQRQRLPSTRLLRVMMDTVASWQKIAVGALVNDLDFPGGRISQ